MTGSEPTARGRSDPRCFERIYLRPQYILAQGHSLLDGFEHATYIFDQARKTLVWIRIIQLYLYIELEQLWKWILETQAMAARKALKR